MDLAESLLLAAVGAAFGALFAQWLSRFLVAFLTTDSNRIFVALSLDWRIFGFAAALAAVTCLLFGLLPAIRATRTAPGVAMKAGSRGSTDTRERFGMRRALVVAQVALSLVLVVGALLFARSLRNLMTLDAGFARDGIVIASLDLRRTGVATEQLPAIFADITARLAVLPGIDAAAQAFIVPVSGSGWNDNIVVDGKKQKEHPNFNSVSADYFKAMGTPVLLGRAFDDRRDTAGSQKVVIVNESFVKTFLGGRNPIGQGFQVQEAPGAPRPLYEIVGVVKDTKYTDLREPFGPIGYFPASQGRRLAPIAATSSGW